MLSAVISSVLSYPALQLALQPVHQWYVHPGPLVLGTAPLNSSTRIADRDRTVSRRSEPSSRTTLIGEQPKYQPVIPGVPFIRWAMALPLRTTGSLWPSFDSARLVSLTVRQAYAIALHERFLTVLSLPSHASVTFWEATAPVKLPTIQCLVAG